MNIKNTVIRYLLLTLNSGKNGFETKLQSEKSLAIKFSCNRLTIQSAIEVLKSVKLVKSIPGKGNYWVNNLKEDVEFTNILNYDLTTTRKIEFNQIPIGFLFSAKHKQNFYKKNYYLNDVLVGQSYFFINFFNGINNKEFKTNNLLKNLAYYGICVMFVQEKKKFLKNDYNHDLKSKFLVEINSNLHDENSNSVGKIISTFSFEYLKEKN